MFPAVNVPSYCRIIIGTARLHSGLRKNKIKYALAIIDAQCFRMLHMMKVSVIRQSVFLSGDFLESNLDRQNPSHDTPDKMRPPHLGDRCYKV